MVCKKSDKKHNNKNCAGDSGFEPSTNSNKTDSPLGAMEVVLSLAEKTHTEKRAHTPAQKWVKTHTHIMAMGQNPNRTPSEHPNPTTKIKPKMGGAPTPKWDPIDFDPQQHVVIAPRLACRRAAPSLFHSLQKSDMGSLARDPAVSFMAVSSFSTGSNNDVAVAQN